MNRLIWLSPNDGNHVEGIQILSRDDEFVNNLTNFVIPEFCRSRNCRYFIQGREIRETGKVSWGFVEFFGETDQMKMLEIIELINKRYGKEIYSEEVLLEIPSRELLIELELL